MLVLAREIHNLGHLGFGDLVGVDAADADPALVHMQHDAGRLLPALGKKPFENVNNELHRRVVVIQHQNLIHRRLLRLRLRLDDDACAWTFLAASSVVAHLDPSRWRVLATAMILALSGPVKGLSKRSTAAADRPAHSARNGRLRSRSTMSPIAMPRCRTASTASAIGISTVSRAARSRIAAAVATPSTTLRRAARASARRSPRPSAAPRP